MQAEWIWLDAVKYPAYQKTYFGMQCKNKDDYAYGVAEFVWEIRLAKQPDAIELRVSGDTVFRLWMNETFVGLGPAAAGGDFLTDRALPWHYANRYTLPIASRVLRFFAQVQLSPQVLTEFSQGQGGFYLEGKAIYNDGPCISFGTNEQWRARLNPCFCAPSSYDGTKRPDDWHPAACTNDRRRLIDAPIPMLSFTEIYPSDPMRQAVPAVSGTKQTVQFDKIYAGYVGMRASGACRLRIACFEVPQQIVSEESVVFAAAGEYRSFRLHSIGGYRITIEAADAAVQLIPSVHFSCYPVKQEGYLRTNDPALNKVYDLCKWTLRICRQTLHLDSPLHQELLACTGDYYIETLMTLFTFGDLRLAALDVRRTADWLVCNRGRMFHTTYSLIWVQMLARVYGYTNDMSLLQDAKAGLVALLSLFHSYLGENGVLEKAPDYMFVDWTEVQGYSMHHPPKSLGQTVLNAFYYKALTEAVRLAKTAGWTAEAGIWRERALALKSAFHRCFYDASAGLYMDGLPTPSAVNRWQPENPPLRHFSRYANTLAALYDLCPAEMEKHLVYVAAREDSGLPQVQPYFMHFILEAVDKAGLFAEFGLSLFNGWKHLAAQCDKGLQEGWIPPQKSYRFDYSHAWGGTPAYHLPLLLTGFQMRAPGFGKVAFSPKLYGLDYADVAFPTPFGMIRCLQRRGEPPQMTVPQEIPWEFY